MDTKKHTLAFALSLVLFLGAPVAADEIQVSDSVLAADGVLFTVRSGEYGSLFPDGAAASEDNPVLSLSITNGAEEQNLLIPGTEDDDFEMSPSLVIEDVTRTVYVLWESWYGLLHSRLYLAAYDEAGWSEIIEIEGAPFVVKSSPQLMITRDELLDENEVGEAVTRQRTFLHLFWIEERAGGVKTAVYAPQLLIDGKLMSARSPEGSAIALNDYLVASEEESSSPTTTSLLKVRKGVDPQSVIVTFSDELTQQLVTLDIRPIPGELSHLASKVSNWLADLETDDTGELVQAARTMVADSARGIQPTVVDDLADELASCLAGASNVTPAADLASACAERLLDRGFELDRSGIKKIWGKARPQWIGVGYKPRPGKPTDEQQHVAARVASVHPMPDVMTRHPVTLVVSADGESLIAYWIEEPDDGRHLIYRETSTDGWSGDNVLMLDASSEEAVANLLRNRLDLH